MPHAEPVLLNLQDWIGTFMRRSMRGLVLYMKENDLSASQIGALFQINRGRSNVSDLAEGLGISLAANLGRIEFDLDPVQGLQLAAWDGDPTIARTWSILRFDPAPGYVAAVASVHPIRTLALKTWLHNAAD